MLVLQVAVFDYVRAAFASEELYKLISPQTRDTSVVRRRIEVHTRS